MYRATLMDYLTVTTIIEEEFGLKWLDKRAKTPKQPGQAGWHPIPRDWREAKDILAAYDRTGVIRPTPALISLMSFAHDLRRARSLSNYRVAIQRRFRAWREFPKVQYEVYVAALCARSGHNLLFIPPSTVRGKKTPDLKLLTNGDAIYVECVRKDSYQLEQAVENVTWETLEQQIREVLGGLATSHEVIVIALSFINKTALPNILHDIQQHILDQRGRTRRKLRFHLRRKSPLS